MDCKCYVARSIWTPSNVERLTFQHDPNCNHDHVNSSFKLKKSYQHDKIQAICYHDHKNVCKIPKNLVAIFPNLIAIDLNGCGMTKVTRSDLVGLHSLREISLRHMKIEIIEGN